MRSAAALVLALATGALAYDSKCYVSGGGECAPGPQSARERWMGDSDEHRQLWERTRELAKLPPSASADFSLDVFTDDRRIDVAGTLTPTLEPVAFFDAALVQTRTMSAGEFSQLPDFGFALWDWVTGLETCPLDPALPQPAAPGPCHDFTTHMGTVNSNHFLPQAQVFFAYYHQLALGRAAVCRTMKERLDQQGPDFQPFVEACRQQALVLEAIGHHFLQDAWSSGHMWERWGSPDLIDFTDLPRSLLVAMTSGLIHGARGVLQEQARFVGYDVNDALCAPGPFVTFATAGTPAAPGLGDLFLGALLAGDGASFPVQFDHFFSCATTSLRQVFQATGETLDPVDAPLREVADPTGEECFGQRATNRAMAAGIGLDYTDPVGTPHRIELDSLQAAQLIPLASAFVGGDTNNVNPAVVAQYAFDMSAIVARARVRAALEPTGTDLARGGLGTLLGVQPNSAFLQQPPAPYIDPPLPWPDPGTAANDAPGRALGLARAFHRSHAIEWCNRFRSGHPDFLDVEALRSKIETLRAIQATADEIEAACAVCTEFAARHLRVGTGEGDYDRAREPLCHFLADDPDAAQYVYQPGEASDGIPALARGYCGCGCPTEFAGTLSANIDQSSFTDENGRTRNGFEHKTFTVSSLLLNPNGTFTATGTFSISSLDAFTFPGDPGETCHTSTTVNGGGAITGYDGTLANPVGSLQAVATISRASDISPCMGQPGSTSTTPSQQSFFSPQSTPTFQNGCLVGMTWNFFFFDPSTNTTDSISGELSAVN
jgi:hypothetical protein